MAREFLKKKGKKGSAEYIRLLCSSTNNNSSFLNELFDVLLDFNKPIDDNETIEWCRCIIAGGKTPDEFTQTVKKYDYGTACGLVWTTNFVAYRCRTCSISHCMSLCLDCFQGGNHEGHDFNMFRSLAGGACDCGDANVMKEIGFCNKHGSKPNSEIVRAPPELTCVAEELMPKLFNRLIQHVREHCVSDSSAMQRAENFISLLHQYSKMGSEMRGVMTRALTDPKLYSELAVFEQPVDTQLSEKAAYLKQNYENYKKALINPDGMQPDSLDPSLRVDRLTHENFLGELVFWTIEYEFPQKIVCLLLNLMPDLNYKRDFSKTYVYHYHKIGSMLAKCHDSDTLSNRVVHVSVQLFSNEILADTMTQEYSLLHVMINTIHEMMKIVARTSTMQNSERNTHSVVDCSLDVLKYHCYWPVVSDLNNVFTHKSVAFYFLRDRKLLKSWFVYLSLFQGMNVNQRQLKAHIEFEPNTYYAAFSAELEASATAMWALLNHLENSETLHLADSVMDVCLKALLRWLDAISFTSDEDINPYQVSFHLPLHRYFSAFFCQAVRKQGSTFVPDVNTLKLIMMHPLQAQVAFYEILCGMWVRSGLQIKGQAMTHIQCHFCNSFVDADMFLLQLCCMYLDSDYFTKTVMNRFHVWDWLTFHPNRANSFLETDQVLPMMEGALTFIATLMSTRLNISLTDDETARKEMVSLLCMSDRTHSQLMDLLPDKCGSTQPKTEFESTLLSQVARYKAPNFESGGTMMQGTYVPKSNIWEEEYDPIHVLLRAVHRREYQSSMDRFSNYLKHSNQSPESGSPWPPFRIPEPFEGTTNSILKDPRKLLHSKTMHGIIFTVLYRALNEPEMPEQILALCVYLLDMAIQFPNDDAKNEASPSSKCVADLHYNDWFTSNDTLTNISTTIQRINVTDKIVVELGMVEEMEVEEEEEEEDLSLFMDALNYDVQSPIVEEDSADGGNHEQRQTNHLALPASDSLTTLVPVQATSSELVISHIPIEEFSNSTYAITQATSSTVPGSTTPPSTSLESDINMAVVPTSVSVPSVLPIHLPKIKHILRKDRLRYLAQRLPQLSHPSSETSSTQPMKVFPFCNNKSPIVNESILSLLVAVHSKLSGKSDSYRLMSERNETVCNDSRIGSGADVIGRLLDRITLADESKESEIFAIQQRLWPKMDEPSPSRSNESIDKEEKRRKAKERQQKLMAEFASKQKAFLQKTMEADTKETPATDTNDDPLTLRQEYECVICGQTAVSDEKRPMGIVVLLQATSVLGHSNIEPASARRLPCSDGEKNPAQKGQSMASHMGDRFQILYDYFDNKYWQLAVNIGWSGGVHVHSCGHHLHIDCHKSYMQSLRCQSQPPRHQNLNVERGEYACPLCRQLANAVIPINPTLGEMGAIVCCRANDLPALASDLSELMAVPLSQRESNILKTHMHNIMEDLTNATYHQYRTVCFPNSSSVFLFVCSIARTNLEIDLLQTYSNAKNKQKSFKCFLPLLHVLSLHSKFLVQSVPAQIWTQLTGQATSDNYSVAVVESEVPILLRDCVAIFLQIILTLPLNIDRAYFNCVVQVLYNVVFLQSVAQLACSFSPSQLSHWQQVYENMPNKSAEHAKMNNFVVVLGEVMGHLKETALLCAEDKEMAEVVLRSMEWNERLMDFFVQEICLHFLRIASLLQSYLFSEQPPLHLKDSKEEFASLCSYLGLTSSEEISSEGISSASCLRWATNDPTLLIRTWCQDFTNFADKSVEAARNLLTRPVVWYPPALLKLPHNYDHIFQYYHKLPCSECNSIPKDPSLCLVCGTMVCLRENCCRQQSQFEAVRHSVACGAGTAIYLAVNSSTIVVIRGSRACLWGSVYLDSYGEEDRDLKRGKPLYLSEDRYELLQSQWLNHRFNHTNKRWVWHKDNL